MPMYTVTAEIGRINPEQAEKLAVGITNTHGEETGAPEPLIHVVFNGYPKGVAWSSCKPGSPTVVNASIRAGRSQQIRERMMQRINDLVCQTLNISPRNVIVALFDFKPEWGMEGGMVLPQTVPDEEAAWNDEFNHRFPEGTNQPDLVAG